jgi:hypothetical protein
MLASEATPQNLESVQVAVVLSAAAVVIFWRHVLRLILAIAAITVSVLLTSSAVLIYQSMHHLPK